MHINLRMLECIYLVAAMLIEIPYMAADEFDTRRRMISKSYYQQLRSSERQALVGPPKSIASTSWWPRRSRGTATGRGARS